MKNLFVMLTLVVASAVTSTAEAALRLTLTSGATTQVYYIADNAGGTVDFAIGGLTGSTDVLASNYPGEVLGPDGYATLYQSLTLKSVNAISGFNLTAVLDVIEAVAGVTDNTLLTGQALSDVTGSALSLFTLPGVGPTAVRTSLTNNTGARVENGGSTAAATEIDGALVSSTSLGILKSQSASTADNTLTLITGPYTLSNTVTITGYSALAASNPNLPASTSVTSITEVIGNNVPTNLVPEPTSMALAGFAGIGMAFGAIRRRRQVNQAA